MKSKYVAASVAVMVAAPVAAFMPTISSAHIMSPRIRHGYASTARPGSSLRMTEKVEAEVVSGKSATAAKTEELIESAKEVYGSVAAGVSGERGEVWTAAKLGILLFVIFGTLPILGGSLELLAGPGLLLAGAGLTAVSALQLGKNYSPWVSPAEGGVLMTTGVYSLCRHPLYCGLVTFSLGLGFATDSFTRIALACLLGYVLDRMASLEEEKLAEVHPAYKTYKEEVSKFLPTIY